MSREAPLEPVAGNKGRGFFGALDSVLLNNGLAQWLGPEAVCQLSQHFCGTQSKCG